ncbi:MAG TPA: hypothetical protein VMD76_01810 [Candidatus Sulfotelmatobacter sp.]|nr:hypothetical protein [Candidatus Sulfotelmatobacter sp.]
MSNDKPSAKTESFTLALDTWAVFLALALALAVHFNLLRNVPW